MKYSFSFNINVDHFKEQPEKIKPFVKSQLNYGWEFVGFDYDKNSSIPSRVRLNWLKGGIPDIDPFEPLK